MRSFEAFSSHDFELFIADLLGTIDKRRYEVFARGPDQGVDLRYISATKSHAPHIVQCKRYVDSSYSDLKRAARGEAESLTAMQAKPASYRLVTTLKLTPKRKRELAEILNGFVSGDQDIIGAGDLETLLDANQAVERRHPKLWLTGGIQLEAVLNKGPYERSKQLLEETKEALPRYVETKAFFTAREKLREERALVISGSPGIGKTTLARMLLADAALEGYEPIEISEDAEEANAIYRADSKQAFYYDDFLGTTFLLDRLAKNEDKRIAQLIRRVSRSKTSLFVMTTREHILNQAAQFYEDLKNEGVDAKRYLLELKEYTRLDKAHIFYNHIYSSSQLDDNARGELLEGRNYEKVIDHRNYNPRLIEHITGLGSRDLTDTDCQSYVDFAVGILDQPSQIWRHAFEQQLDEAQRGLLITLASMQSKVTFDDLETAFRGYCQVAKISTGRNLYKRSLKVLDDSFASTHKDAGYDFIELANPSIADFISAWLIESFDEAVFASNGAVFFPQIQWLLRSVVSKLDAGKQDRLLTHLAAGVERLFHSFDPRWQKMRWGGRGGSVKTSRVFAEPVRRLTFLVETMAEYQYFGELLEEFFAERLEEESKSWPEGHVVDNSSPISLLRALRRHGHDSETVVEQAQSYLEKNLDGPYDWRQLMELREMYPERFPLRHWANLQDEFATFAENFIDYQASDLEDLHDIEELEGLADQIGVEINEGGLEEAKEDVNQYIAGRDEQAELQREDERLERGYQESRNETAQVAAVFAHLDSSSGK
jgi:DNA polymerase III delta prime subunit